jgi:CRISPR/Cas system CSM-associated protein Csm2 small subunit
MSFDESIGKIEVDPKEEASVVEVFQDVLDKISDVEKKDKLLKFFKIVFGF